MAIASPPYTPLMPAAPSPRAEKILYPDSDGKPMADNTLQFQWIVTIKENLEALYADRDDVFVAGDLLWYPVEGKPRICAAPDAMVVFGRPKGYRGSYKQWAENGVAPQVVFEVLSPGNTPGEMAQKGIFYDLHGVAEYYIYDPDKSAFSAMLRSDEGHLETADVEDSFRSPRLNILFDVSEDELAIFRPDGERFRTFGELHIERTNAVLRADAEAQRADAEAQRADAEAQRADAEAQRTNRLIAQLRAAGIEPEDE